MLLRHISGSLRWRLVGAMLLVFALGLLAAVLVDPPEPADPSMSGWLMYLREEPYQDFLLLVPFTTVALAIMWAVSGWSLRQLALASKKVSAIGPANVSGRIPVTKMPSEVLPLIEAANGALDRLAASYEAEQRFVAQVAHQLRTPLAVASLRVQRARSGLPLDLSGLEGDLHDLQRFTERLLDLARKEQARYTRHDLFADPVNLSRTAREVVAGMLPLFEHAGRPLTVDLPPNLLLRGRAADLADLVTNLLENALKHGSGTVSLSAGTLEEKEQSWAVLTVADQGPGIPPEFRDRMFSRFARGDGHSQGHGLGLAIVKEVVEAHGGTVTAAPDAGTRMVVRLPLSEQEFQAEAKSRPLRLTSQHNIVARADVRA